MSSRIKVESVPCNLCGAEDAQALFDGRDRLHHVSGQFQVVRCRHCGLTFLNPRPVPADMARYYPADYQAYTTPLRAAQGRVSRWDFHYGLYKRLRAVSAFQPGGRLLDVGCATGDFLAFARDRGWDVQGVELVDSIASFCRDTRNLPVVTGDLLDAHFPPDHWDVVTLWNVLEHLYDPKATLREIGRILRPGGLLVMALPNLGCLDARIFGPAWSGYDVPRHLYVFSQATLTRMLAETGFRVLQLRCLDSSHFVFFYSLRYWLQDKPGWQRAQPWVEWLENSRVVRLLTAPYFRVVDGLAQGPLMTVFARRGLESDLGSC